MAPRFPPDIDFLIIDQCQDDRSLLSNCSLVCHAWATLSRTYLFREVVMEVTEGSREHLVQFIHSLYTSPTGFGAHVKRLRLVGLKGRDSLAQFYHPFHPERRTYHSNQKSVPLETAFVQIILHVLPNLDVLMLPNLRLIGDVATTPSNPRYSLSLLQIDYVLPEGDRGTEVISLLSLFSTIQTLSLRLSYASGMTILLPFHDMDMTASTTQKVFRGQCNVDVHSLLLSRSDSRLVGPIFNHIRGRRDATLGQEFNCAPPEPYDLDCMGVFSQLAGPSIRTMRVYPEYADLGVNPNPLFKECWRKLSLGSCVNLQSLVFYVTPLGPPQRGFGASLTTQALFQYAMYVLTLPELPPIERVVFHLNMPSEEYPAIVVPDWEYMDQILDRIRSLRAVILDFAPGSTVYRTRFGERLARAHEKGILQFRENTTPVQWWRVPG
ncbi:hypothetical protein C8Q76DRAFT_796447 [Earliella scabrosa]|nr:hypothetical protein C8Q76DRAFT_796447 [Earliella scabrosa]